MTPQDRGSQHPLCLLVHGFKSSAAVWDPFISLAETENADWPTFLRFEYGTGVANYSLTRRMPSQHTLADQLSTTVAQNRLGRDLILVGHSQGGVVIQRYLKQLLERNDTTTLASIKRVVLFACPNFGSDRMKFLRKLVAVRNPQERQLRGLNDEVARVHHHIVQALTAKDSRSPVKFNVYIAAEDGIVRPASGRGSFLEASIQVLPGDHSSILQPQGKDDARWVAFRDNVLLLGQHTREWQRHQREASMPAPLRDRRKPSFSATGSRLAFVHLAQLQFGYLGSDDSESQHADVLKQLADDLVNHFAELDAKPEAILLTGGVSRSAARTQYRAARVWLDELCARLGIDNTRVLVVPDSQELLGDASGAVGPEHETSTSVVQAHEAYTNYLEFAAAYACELDDTLVWHLPAFSIGTESYVQLQGSAQFVRGIDLNKPQSYAGAPLTLRPSQVVVLLIPDVDVESLDLDLSNYVLLTSQPQPGGLGHEEPEGQPIVLQAGTEGSTFRPIYNIFSFSTAIVQGREHIKMATVASQYAPLMRRFVRSPAIERAFTSQGRLLAAGQQSDVDTETTRGRHSTADATSGGLEPMDAPEQPNPFETAPGTPDPERSVRSAFERLGSGDRLRLLDRLEIERSLIAGLPPHKQIQTLARHIVGRSLEEAFFHAIAEIGT